MTKPRQMTDEEKAFIITNHKTMSVRQIATALDRSWYGVHGFLRNNGFKDIDEQTRRPREIADADGFFNPDYYQGEYTCII